LRNAYEDGTECSETSEYKLKTPGNYTEESIRHSEHDKSLESKMFIRYYFNFTKVFCMFRVMKVHHQEVSCRIQALWYNVMSKYMWCYDES